MPTQLQTKKFSKKKVKNSIKKKTYQNESLLIYLKNAQQKKVFQALCKAFKIDFELKHQEEKKSLHPDLIRDIEKGREDIKAGRFREITDINDLWKI